MTELHDLCIIKPGVRYALRTLETDSARLGSGTTARLLATADKHAGQLHGSDRTETTIVHRNVHA